MTATAFQARTEDDRAAATIIAIVMEALPAAEVEKVVAKLNPAQRLDLIDIVTEHRARAAR